MKLPDLNKLKRDKPEKQEKTIEQRIADLRAEIVDLETKVDEPTEVTEFLTLDPPSQEMRVKNLNATLPPDDQYTLEDYIVELRQSEPSITKVRLEAAKLKLVELLRLHSKAQ